MAVQITELTFLQQLASRFNLPTPEYNSHEFLATMLNFFQSHKEWIDQNEKIDLYSNKKLTD